MDGVLSDCEEVDKLIEVKKKWSTYFSLNRMFMTTNPKIILSLPLLFKKRPATSQARQCEGTAAGEEPPEARPPSLFSPLLVAFLFSSPPSLVCIMPDRLTSVGKCLTLVGEKSAIRGQASERQQLRPVKPPDSSEDHQQHQQSSDQQQLRCLQPTEPFASSLLFDGVNTNKHQHQCSVQEVGHAKDSGEALGSSNYVKRWILTDPSWKA
ncbi:hypothetical protein H5410_000432 [Solanum commersonii]|uniref:Uncharacterized protein n=1 Tax=Solanum commersonii TaxID=4109 RepID=A0A9J6AWW1_SOLCO|nr:hypothetical protein H5410_000432 [Solanum commersonii]